MREPILERNLTVVRSAGNLLNRNIILKLTKRPIGPKQYFDLMIDWFPVIKRTDSWPEGDRLFDFG